MRRSHLIGDFFTGRNSFVISTLALFFSLSVCAQETNSHVSGIVKSEKNEVLPNATVVVVHEPTRNTYSTLTNSKGYFYLFNVRPGGPYSISISYTGFELLLKTNLFLSYTGTNFNSYLQEGEFSEFIMKERNNLLDEVILKITKQAERKFGTETNIDNERIHSLPSISRNLQDYVRLVPNAKINGDGISLAGQNNKYNAFFVDGSNTNDLLGLANSGTAGGQTNSPPISIEAIEEIKVLQSPYDVQYSNFTGGSINAITRSGSNQFKASAWYFFRNEKMAGKSPLPMEVPGSPGVFERSRLSHFFNQTAGTYASGAFVKNRLFYFLLAEFQNESQPQPYNFLEYKGNSTQQHLADLTDTIQKRYGYDPGSFLESGNVLDAKRITAKLDWNPDTKNKLTLSYRYNGAERITSQLQNSSTVIRFSNNRFRLPSTINSASLEWKRYFRNSASNRFLLNYNHEETQRKIIGQPFPLVGVKDGAGTITFGSNAASNTVRFTASEFGLVDAIRFVKNKHVISAGIDLDFANIRDLSLGSYFGSYRFSNLNDFISNNYPIQYIRNLSLASEKSAVVKGATAKYNPIRVGAFFNDELQVNENLKLTAGARIDANALPLKYEEDSFFNTTAHAEIEKYYDLEGAVSGSTMKTDWRFSPRFGFHYKIPKHRITIRGGAGIFSGHILNVWASQIYAVNIATLDIAPPDPPRNYGLHFNPDPYNQPDFQSLGLNPDSVKRTLVLVSRNYKYPTVFRSSLSIDKQFKNNWTWTTELLFTKNIYENRYTNVNLLPATKTSAPPGSRNVYSSGVSTETIPMTGGNPYIDIFLLGNNHGPKGFSYAFTSVVSKSISNNLLVNLAYCFANSVSLFEPVGNANTTDGQWVQRETVNGKNMALQSISDFDMSHRISAVVTKKFNYGKWASMITLFYNGQSGSPFSYVYNNSLINDAGPTPANNSDLIYIPTKQELNEMIFIPITSGTFYSVQQQKDFLNDYIEQDNYLHKHRGQFAERNAARLPFTHTVDLRLHQDFKIRLNKRESTISVIYDVFNFMNMLNKNWGRTYFLSSNDNYALITFAGYANPNTLTPQWQFKPFTGKPWSVQNNTAPGVSARWISQLGVKVSF